MKKISIVTSLIAVALFAIFFGSINYASAQTVYVIDTDGNLVEANDPRAQNYLSNLNGGGTSNTNGGTTSNNSNTGNGNGTSTGAVDPASTFVPYPYMRYEYTPSAIAYYNGTHTQQNTQTQYSQSVSTFQQFPTLKYTYHNKEQNAVAQSKLYGSGASNVSAGRSVMGSQGLQYGPIGYNTYGYMDGSARPVNTNPNLGTPSQPLTFGGGTGFTLVSEH